MVLLCQLGLNMYIQQNGEGVSIIVLYVGDQIITSNNLSLINTSKQSLKMVFHMINIYIYLLFIRYSNLERKKLCCVVLI
jgi:hypothetical protein